MGSNVNTARDKTIARDEIMRSIRSHLATSSADIPLDQNSLSFDSRKFFPQTAATSVVEEFKRNLEAVDGHCLVVNDDPELAEVVKRIAKGKKIAVSNATRLKKLIEDAELEQYAEADQGAPGLQSVQVVPSAKDLFNFDVGITSAQAGIAETGTLVLDSSVEQNRLVSLVPPIHIAILDASRIYATLGETLAALKNGGKEVSPAITLITGPSRTADIELTLAIGVHGPQEIYVIINQSS